MPLADGGSAPSKSAGLVASKKRSRDGSPLPHVGSIPSAATDFSDPDVFADAPMFSAAALSAPKVDKVAEAVAAADIAAATKDRYAQLLEDTTPSIGELAIRGRAAEREKEAQADDSAGAAVRALQASDPNAGVGERTAAGWAALRKEALQEGSKVDVEREMVDSSKRAQRKGLNEQRGGGVEAMTTEEYNALTPKQKAAIDFNTLLVEAVRSDRRLTRKGVLKDGSKEYDASVDELFGEGASENARYAPATVQLLDSANIDAVGAKLNDFLKLKVAITADDLKDFEPPRPGEGPDLSLATAGKQREGLQSSLIGSVRETRKDPADANALRTASRSLLGMDDMPGFGPARPVEQGGSLEEQVNFYFQGGLQRLAAEPDTQKVMADLRAGMPEEYWPKFIAFLDASSRESKQYHMPITVQEDGSEVRPKEFRSRLGLNRTGDRDATR